jgi:hypothetical protein
MAYIKKRINGKMVKVYAIETKCKNRKCLVISDCNTPGHYYCRINEVSGCPIEKDK